MASSSSIKSTFTSQGWHVGRSGEVRVGSNPRGRGLVASELCQFFTVREVPVGAALPTVGYMNRHLALTVAGLSAVLVTAVSGTVAANVGLLNVGAEKPVGQLTAANVGQLVAPDSVLAGRSSTGAPGASGLGSETVVSIDPNRPSPDAGTRNGLSGSAPSPKGDSAGLAVSAASASGLAPSDPSPRGATVQGPPVTAGGPAPSTPTTSRSSEDEHEDDEPDEHEEDDEKKKFEEDDDD